MSSSISVFDSEQADTSQEGFDFHKAITKKERSSRYLRTAIDYYRQTRGEAACDEFLSEIGLSRESSIYTHIYDDENWNSYELEVYFYDRLKDKFSDPYQAIWEFGVASGSGYLDQKDVLFSFKVKVAPIKIILNKLSDTTEMMSLISRTSGTMLPRTDVETKGMVGATVHFNYERLPEGFKYPHWTSIVAGYGIVYGVIHNRKGLEVNSKITHWPILPSDLPSYNGKKYRFDKATKDVIEEGTGEVIANANQGPFLLDGVTFNHGLEAICHWEWKPESVWTLLARSTIQRRSLRKEQEIREMKDKLIRELSVEHQHQLARYEHELSEKMEEIRRLKVQQDGDYFLTSLLTKPLIVNSSTSETVAADFIVKQKKEFSFRNRHSELGGDICVVKNVTLQGRDYTCFANGDAMGKSMQGAGGALVMGVVFNAYLTRSHFSDHQKRKSPELWLRDCYYELQNAFLSFEGSMYVSVTAGLVDELNGMLYYINAEHPRTVLYRNKRAGFLEDELWLRKLGTPGEESAIRIRTFQLQPGDTVICGSDGRDDIEIGEDENGFRIINENESEFLKRTQEAKADIRLMMENLEKFGKLTDDISILSLRYRAGEQPLIAPDTREFNDLLSNAIELYLGNKLREALEILENLCKKYPDKYEVYRYLSRVDFKLKIYDRCIQNTEKYLTRYPADTDLLYVLSNAYKEEHNLPRAIEYGQRAVLRNPERVKYLLNLIDCYRLSGDKEDAFEYMQKARELSPENQDVQEMELQLDRAEFNKLKAGHRRR